MTEGVIVTMQDCRSVGYCARGVREMFERYNLDYSDFLQNGMDSEKMLEVSNHDYMVEKVVEAARGRK